LLIAVLVLIVVNAQLTWWIIFVLRQNRSLLDLQRNRLIADCRVEVSRMTARTDEAFESLSMALLAGRTPQTEPSPIPFSEWHEDSPDGSCLPQWKLGEGMAELRISVTERCVVAKLDDRWLAKVLHLPQELELVELLTVDRRPEAIPLDGLLADWGVRPRNEVWDALLEDYRRRIVMMVSEGSFFAVLLVVLMGMMWRTVRREVELERQHRNFLSAITHELKSPVAAIRLSLETVFFGRADEETSRRFISNALADTDRLEELVAKVLEATRLGVGTTGIQLRRECVSEVVQKSVAAFAARAAASGAVFRENVDADLWSPKMDSGAMAIAVSNLIENALKYGGNPAVVDVKLTHNRDGAVLEVADNGSGVPEHEIPFIFDRFYRAGDELTRTSQGIGLGLYLVQRIVKAHGGTVTVGETGSDGTTFRVVLPGVEKGEEPR
jgi:signal transduction histidine kinase